MAASANWRELPLGVWSRAPAALPISVSGPRGASQCGGSLSRELAKQSAPLCGPGPEVYSPRRVGTNRGAACVMKAFAG
ncbi:hypothetical protein WJX75_000851 [Coccomyxa subellipsoidea]|uniref:Uncharacterized protein n=1 Tax=Coccomyxa subellipsoidea TaxID=248742 RepID=A0ABR2YZJ2_9CHLO